MANIGALTSKAAQKGASILEKTFDRISTIMREGAEKVSAEDLAWVEKNYPNSSILKQAKAYNAGEEWTKAGPSTAENRGMTRGQAKEVNRLKRADEADAELARQEKAGVGIEKKFAAERESRIAELSNFRAAEQAKAEQYKKEAIAGGMNAFDASKEAQRRIDENINNFAKSTSKDLAAEEQFPTPPISSNAPPVSSLDARIADANKKKMLVKEDKATTAERSADAGQRNKEALGKMPGKPYSDWASTYKPDESIPSATPSVITPSGAKTESEKLTKLQDEFSSTTVTPSETTAKTAKQPKAKAAKGPKAEAAPAPAAEAKAPATPAMDFKGMSLAQVDEAVKNNPDLKTAAINYAKTKEKASWKNWVNRAEAEAAPAAEAAAPKAAPLSKLQETAAPELAAKQTTAPATEAQAAVQAPAKGKPRATKAATQQEVAKTLEQEKAPTFVQQSTGNPIKESEASALSVELQQAQKQGPEAVSKFTGKLKALGLGVLGAGGYVLAIKENQRANSSENVLVNNLVNSANLLNEEPQAEPQSVQTQKVSGGGAGGGTPAVSETVAPTARPATAPAAAAKPSPVKVENPQDLQNFWTKIQEVATPISQLDKATQDRLKGQENELTTAIRDATTAYNESIKGAKDEAARRETIATWGQIFETLGQAAIKYFAAREGKRLGQRIGSTLQLEKHDWSSDLNRSLEKLKIDMADAKDKFGMVKEEVETGRKALSREKENLQEQAAKRADMFIRAAVDERERAQVEASRSKMNAEERAFKQAQNAASLKQALQIKQMEIDSRLAVAKTKLSATDKKKADTVEQSYSKSGLLFDNWYDAKAKDKGLRQKEFANASAGLGLTEAETAELSRLSGKPGFFNSDENKAAARAILQQAYNRKIGAFEGTPEAPAETPRQAEPAPGTIKNGYRFKGGDPSKPESWEKI